MVENLLSVFDQIVTGNKTWVHHYDPESKQESPKDIQSRSIGWKFVTTMFWDSKEILPMKYTKKIQCIT